VQIVNKLLDYSTPWAFPDVYLFTGNPIVKHNGAIVMGRGAAQQVRDTYPGIDKKFGTLMNTQNDPNLLWRVIEPGQHIGWFKVKEHWRDPALISVIEESTIQLSIAAISHTSYTFHMNYPGIGNGKLKEKDVEDILTQLPDNVIIYR